MVKKRLMVIASVVVSVLLGGLFLNNVILAQSNGEYDPWLDSNEDGIIDVNDLSPLGQSYGSSGDPTKNVTIVKHASQFLRVATNEPVGPAGMWTSGWIWVDGYSKVTILIYLTTSSNELLVDVADSGLDWSWQIDHAVGFPNTFIKTYDVVNLQIHISVYNTGGSTAYMFADVYLMA